MARLTSLFLALSLAPGCRGGAGSSRTPEGVARRPDPAGAARRPAEEADDGASAAEGRAPSPAKRPDPLPVSSRAQALRAAVTTNREGAVDFLRPRVDAEPGDLEARVALARALAALGKLDEARATLADARGAPDDERVLRIRADLAWRRGELSEARRLLERARTRHPKALGPQGELLWLWVRTGRGDTPEARALMDALYDAYDEGRARSAADLLAVAQAALARGTTGAFQDANAVLGDAERLAPPSEGSWIGERVALLRGQMFLARYAHDEAAQTYGLLLELDPWHADALAGMAEVALDRLDMNGAVATAERALQSAPDHPGARSVLARVALVEGRREVALEHARAHALATDPAHPQALSVLAAAAILRGDERTATAARQRAADPVTFARVTADLLVFLHLYDEADRVLAGAVERFPKEPSLVGAYAASRLRLGDETRGLALLRRAWRRDHFNQRTDNILRLYEKRIEPAYETTEGDRLAIRLPKKDARFVEPHLRAQARRARDTLDRAYGPVRGRLRLEFFSSPQEFAIRTVGVPNLGAAAVCFGPLITFVGPYLGSHNLDGVIWHEMAHVYAIRDSRGRVPRWLTEGLSEWEAELYDPANRRRTASLLDAARRAGRLRHLSELELAFIRARDGKDMEIAYSLAAYAVRWLGETHGRPKLIAMLRAYATGAETEQVVREVLGVELPELERRFDAWLAGELGRLVRGWVPDPKHPGRREALLRTAAKHLSADEPEVASAKLRALIDAGGDGFTPRLLLARIAYEAGKIPKAREEAEKARAFRPESSEPLALLARMAARTFDVKGEIAALTAILDLDANAFDPAARLLLLAQVTGRPKVRARALSRAAGIAPVHPMVLSARALDLAAAGRRDDARAHLDRAVEQLEGSRGPGDTRVMAALAAAALHDLPLARRLAEAARADARLPRPARAALDRISRTSEAPLNRRSSRRR